MSTARKSKVALVKCDTYDQQQVYDAVDEGNRLMALEPGKSSREIAVEAGRNRFMPILLTSITTIAGLIPLAVGETMFKPLALVIIGGLSTSTVLTLLCIPTLYAYLSPKSKKP